MNDADAIAAICGIYLGIGVLVLRGIALLVWAVIDCVRRQFPEESTKLIWILVIVLLGGLGAPIYAFAGRSMGVMPEQYRRGGSDGPAR